MNFGMRRRLCRCLIVLILFGVGRWYGFLVVLIGFLSLNLLSVTLLFMWVVLMNFWLRLRFRYWVGPRAVFRLRWLWLNRIRVRRRFLRRIGRFCLRLIRLITIIVLLVATL